MIVNKKINDMYIFNAIINVILTIYLLILYLVATKTKVISIDHFGYQIENDEYRPLYSHSLNKHQGRVPMIEGIHNLLEYCNSRMSPYYHNYYKICRVSEGNRIQLKK